MGDELCNIRHEVDLSEYDTTVIDGGDLSVTIAAAMGGTARGLQLLIDDQVEIYGVKDIATALTQIRFRFYLDPNGITIADGTFWPICTWYAVGGNIIAIIFFGYTVAGGYRVAAQFEDDDGAWDLWLGWFNVTDAAHYIELHAVAESGDGTDDGTAELWVDDVSQGTLSSMDNWAIFGAGLRDVYFGALWNVPAGANGAYYLDELRANDDGRKIGPGEMSVRTIWRTAYKSQDD